MPVPVLAIVIPFVHLRRGVGAQNGRNNLPRIIHAPVLVFELLDSNRFLPMVQVIFDGPVLDSYRKPLQLENQIIARRHIRLTPDIAHITRQPTHKEGADEIDGERDRAVPALVLPALQLRRVGHAPRPRHLADESDGVAHGESPSLCVRVLDKAQIDHELLPIVRLALIPEALQACEEIVDGHQVHNRVHHARELQALERGDVFHHGPSPVDAEHESDIADVDRMAQRKGPLRIRIRQIELRDDLLHAVRDVEVRGLIAEVGGFAIVVRGHRAVAEQIRRIVDPRRRQKRRRRRRQRSVVHDDVRPAHV